MPPLDENGVPGSVQDVKQADEATFSNSYDELDHSANDAERCEPVEPEANKDHLLGDSSCSSECSMCACMHT